MTCPVHRCELAECAMWAEVAQLPMKCKPLVFTVPGRVEIEMLPSDNPYFMAFKASFIGLPNNIYGAYE